MKHIPKIAILTPFPAPYRIPLFNALSDISDIETIILITELKGVPNQKWPTVPDGWYFPYTVLPGMIFPYNAKYFGKAYYPINFTLPVELLIGNYDVVVTLGWTALNSNIALFMRKLLGTATILWETSIPHPPSRFKKKLEPFIKRLISSYDAYIASSSLCIKNLHSYGAKKEKIFLMPQVIDFEYYKISARKFSKRQQDLANKYDTKNRRIICYVGQIIERKGLLLLIEAVSNIVYMIPEITLIIAGVGPLEMEAKKLCKKLGLDKDIVKFLGFVPKSKLPEVYAISELFVLPSYYDTFGAVVLEAMASGLPVVITEGVGAAYDVVIDGVNGFVVPVGSVRSLSLAIYKIIENRQMCKSMVRASQDVLKGWNIFRAVNGFRDAINNVLKS